MNRNKKGIITLMCLTAAFVSVGCAGTRVSAASNTPAPNLVQPIKADSKGAPVRTSSSSGSSGQRTGSTGQSGQRTSSSGNTGGTQKTSNQSSEKMVNQVIKSLNIAQTVLKNTTVVDLSDTYSWQHQNGKNACWKATGSVNGIPYFGESFSQDYIGNFHPDGNGDLKGGAPYVIDAINSLPQQQNNETKVQIKQIKNPSKICSDIPYALDNGHGVYLSTSYENPTNPGNYIGHDVECVGYSKTYNDIQLLIMDPAAKNEFDGIYWTSTLDTNNSTYTVPDPSPDHHIPANDYKEVHIDSGFYIIG